MTNQPAEGTFSRLMATTTPVREKQPEEQEKAIRPPVLKTPQPQKGKNQVTPTKKPRSQQTPTSSNALQQLDGISATPYPSAKPKKREIKRRQPFDVYQDQVDLLRKISLRDQLNGEIGSMSRMVREALDNYLKDKKL